MPSKIPWGTSTGSAVYLPFRAPGFLSSHRNTYGPIGPKVFRLEFDVCMQNKNNPRSDTVSFLFDILDRWSLFMTEGRAGPYAAAIGRAAYEEMLEGREKKYQRQLLKRLEHQKLIKIQEAGERILLALTTKGIESIYKDHILHYTGRLPHGWLCLVTFDVPEKVREARSMLRRFLKKAGFKRIHKSVWVTNRDILVPFQKFIHALKIDDWIFVYLVQETTVRSR